MRRAHVSVHRSEEYVVAGRARSLDIEDWGRPDFLLQSARTGDAGCGEYDRQRVLQGSIPRVADGVCSRSGEIVGGEPRRQRRVRTNRRDRNRLEPGLRKRTEEDWK